MDPTYFWKGLMYRRRADAAPGHVRDCMQSAWHASCAGRIGEPADARTVVGSSGTVVGTDNLFAADAAVMPVVSRTNTSIPTVMIAERIAEMVRQR
jgi:5-(hydroxymethyl)furfural/furfural oxidase